MAKVLHKTFFSAYLSAATLKVFFILHSAYVESWLVTMLQLELIKEQLHAALSGAAMARV